MKPSVEIHNTFIVKKTFVATLQIDIVPDIYQIQTQNLQEALSEEVTGLQRTDGNYLEEDNEGGLNPPKITVKYLYYYLKWNNLLYKQEGYSFPSRIILLILRVIQRVAYNLGWTLGGRNSDSK